MEQTNLGILKNTPLGDDIVKLCTAPDTVSSLLAADPTCAPGEAWQRLYGDYRQATQAPTDAAGADDLARAAQCGQWGATKPSDLFLQIYRDVLALVAESPGRAMVSPPLLGSCGVAPLTVISTIPDIARHMANVIARADHEVVLATNYWQDSVASRYLTNALRELDRRAARRGVRVVVKVLYDRGSPKQLLDPHYLVDVNEYTGRNVRIPSPDELPSIDMQVMNYHQPLVGTFHAKFMVVDRSIAILQSNNIQDNDNLEMMVHYEGPIVDSFYDMALLSWNKAMVPPLPSHNAPASAAAQPPTMDAQVREPASQVNTPAPTADNSSTSTLPAMNRLHVSSGPDKETAASPSSTGICESRSATSNKETSSGRDEHTDCEDDSTKAAVQTTSPNVPNGPDAATQEFLRAGRHTRAIADPRPEQPSFPDGLLPQSTADVPQYDPDIAHEVARVQAAMTAKPGETGMDAVSRALNHTVSSLKADAPECDEDDAMMPYLASDMREPFPIAMVNRPPFGPPLHTSVAQPQNAAWLSALRNARKNVFIQTPTLNAEPLVPAIYEACERGLDVICYVCLGYNDAGELLPRQGGTNEMIANQLHAALSAEGRKHLHYFWYVARDQTRPIPQIKKQRDCHIKLMIVDECIGIMGSGNQDTQSWYHSQEINVMLENPDVCRMWIDGLRRNQNTHLYGALDKTDGIWRDHDGREADGVMGINPGLFSWAKGIVGAVKRVQGKGGF